MEATRFYPPPNGIIPNLVVLGVANEQELLKAKSKLEKSGIKHEIFVEPDIGNQHTAIATEPIFGEQRRLFRNYRCLGDTAPMEVQS